MQRLDYIDRMKGLAILSVVLGHIYLPYTTEGAMHPIAKIIYSFHMSFFFFLSGFINQKTNAISTKGWMNYIYKKFNSLLILYLFWLIIAPLFLYNSYPTNLRSLTELFSFFPNRHIWFLPTLFIFMMLYLILYKISKIKKSNQIQLEMLLEAISVCCWGICGLIFNQYYLIIYGIYWFSFLLGNSISKYQTFNSFITTNFVWGISTIILCLAWKFYPLEVNGVGWRSLINLMLSSICAFCGSITIYNFFLKAQTPRWIQKYLQEIGKFSLVIYVVPIVLLPKDFLFPESIPETLINLCILGIGILHTFISYTFGRIVFEIPYLRYIMFGKK